MTLKRLAEQSGIPLVQIERLVVGEYEKLPAAPYARGYLRTLGKLLDFDGERVFHDLETRGVFERAGVRDTLPANRFEPRRTRIFSWFAIGALILGSYIAIRYTAIFGKPMISLSSPDAPIITTQEPRYTVRGKITGGDEVSVNGAEITLDESGGFSADLDLEQGLNSLEIKAKKFLGRETTILRQIVYEPPAPEPVSTSTGGALPGTTNGTGTEGFPGVVDP